MADRIGKYKVERELGSGGFGKVYLAFDPDVGQPVAIKKLRTAGDPDLLRRFQLEIRTTASLRHKNIVTIHASGEEAGDPYLVMEFLEGCTLKQVIQDRRPLSLLDKVRIMTQVAEGLAYAHSKGVVHRDVKPENIMLLPDDNVKIMDFGIALGPERDSNVTQTGGIIGTPPYFAPEQLEGSKANEQTDIFSYGDVYYELLTGTHPFEQYKNDWKGLQVAILSYEPRPIGEVVPDYPEALETLVLRTLAKQPEFRYQKFEELQLDGEAIMVDLRHESAAAILREIPALMESGQLQSAMSKIRQAYQLEPGNREIRRLREEITIRIQGEQRQKQVAELLANADKQLSAGLYAEAVQSLELGCKLDPGSSFIAEKLEDARARRDNYINANRLLSEARFKQQKGFLTEAHQKVQEALSIDPANTDAKRLHQRIGDELVRRQLDDRLQEALRSARDHRAARRFADALAVLDDVEREIPGAASIAEMRADIQHEQAEESRRIRSERFNLAITKTREMMDSGDLDRARQMLDHLYANFLSEPAAAELLPALRERLANLVRARDVAEIQHRVRELLQQKLFPEALEVLAAARAKFSDDPGLERLRKTADELYAAHQRAEAIATALKDAAAQRDAGRLQAALDTIVNARRKLGDETSLVDFARLVEMELERQRYNAALTALLKDGRALFTAGKYAEAIARLSGAKEFAAEAEVRALLESSRTEAAIEEERRFTDVTLASAGELESKESYNEALSAVEQALARYPQSPRLTRAASRLRERVERERERALIEGHRAAITREMDAGRWQPAQAALDQARAQFPAEGLFQDLADRIEAGRYEEGWRELEARVNRELAANSIDQIERHLEDQATRTSYARDPRWKALEQQVAQRRGYEDALAQAERHRQAGALSEAEALLTRVINQGTPDMRAMQLRRAIQSRQSEVLRQQEITRIAGEIRDRVNRGELDRADAELGAARSRYPGENSWTELQAELDARRQAARRKAELAAAEERVRQALSRDDIREATAQCNAGRTRFSEEPIWADLQARIQEREAVLRRSAEITRAAESVRRYLARGAAAPADTVETVLEKKRADLRGAGAELDAARNSYPGESLWNTLQSEIETRRELVNAESATAANVARNLQQGEIAAAESELRQARQAFRDEPFWSLLAASISAAKELEKRRAEVARATSAIADLLRRDALQDGRLQLNAARAKYPQETVWQELQAQIDARQAVLDRQADVLAIAQRLRADIQTAHTATAKAGHPIAALCELPQNALRDLDHARAKYPGESAWQSIQTQIAEWQATLQRESLDSVRACNDLASLDAKARQLAAAQTRYPGERFWTNLETEIQTRRAGLERASIAEREAHIREALQKSDLRQAREQLDAAKSAHPQAPAWPFLQHELDELQAAVSRREDLQALEQSVRQHLAESKWEAFEKAAALITAAAVKYPGEPRVAALNSEAAARRAQREAEVTRNVREILRNPPVSGLAAHPAIAEVSFLLAREPAHPLWRSLKSEIDAVEAQLARQTGIATAAQRVRAALQRDDIRQAVAELNGARANYPDEQSWPVLQSEVDAWRKRLQERLLAIERQIGTDTSKRQLKKLDREARDIAAADPDDPETTAISARIQRRIDAAGAGAAINKPFPWKLVAIGGGATLASGALILTLLPTKKSERPKPPPITPVAVEVRTDPPGAAIRIGDRSCVTPNCRIELPPGTYDVTAQLDQYEPARRSVRIDASSPLIELPLKPIAPPPIVAPAGATGTLVVQTGVPDALIYIDNVPQPNRTDQAGKAELTLEAKAHDVRVERNGYAAAAAKRVTLSPGGHAALAFRLLPENARMELDGAPANIEVRIDGRSVGRSDGSAAFLFPAQVIPGDHTVEVSQGLLQSRPGAGSRSLTQRFEPGQRVRLTWKADAAPAKPSNPGPISSTNGSAPAANPPTVPTTPATKGPSPEELEERDWEKIRNTSDASQLRDFRRKYASGKHARDAEAALDRLAWGAVKQDNVDSLRSYLQEFPAGAHASEANNLIGDLAWKTIDQNNVDQLRTFIEQNKNTLHARDAQRKLDQLSATQDVLRKQAVDALNKLNVEFNRKPVKDSRVKETWPTVPRMFLDSLKQPEQKITLTPVEEPKVQGDMVTVRCTMITAQGRVKEQPATVVLRYGAGRWLVSEIRVGQ